MGTGEIAQVVLVRLVRSTGQLVGSGIADVPDEFLEVVVVFGEALGQFMFLSCLRLRVAPFLSSSRWCSCAAAGFS